MLLWPNVPPMILWRQVFRIFSSRLSVLNVILFSVYFIRPVSVVSATAVRNTILSEVQKTYFGLVGRRKSGLGRPVASSPARWTIRVLRGGWPGARVCLGSRRFCPTSGGPSSRRLPSCIPRRWESAVHKSKFWLFCKKKYVLRQGPTDDHYTCMSNVSIGRRKETNYGHSQVSTLS